MQSKIQASKDKIYIDVGFWGGLIPENITEAKQLCEEGIMGLQCSLAPRAEPFKKQFPSMGKDDLEKALSEMQEGTLISVSICLKTKYFYDLYDVYLQVSSGIVFKNIIKFTK